MTTLRFVVPGAPVPQARHRSVALMRNGAPVIGKGGRPITHEYGDPRSKAYEAKVRDTALYAARTQSWKMPDAKVRLGVVVRVWRERRAGDLDNFVKQALDAMTKAGNVWVDDRYVVALSAGMGVDKARPRMEIEVSILGGANNE
jgi:Holliday junction resolvase RusA-like endonuclease